MRLGQVGRRAAQDLDLLLEQPVAAAQLTQLRRLAHRRAGAVTVLDVGGMVGVLAAPDAQGGCGFDPLQAFADLITIEEHKTVKRPKVVLTWAPHCRALPQAVPNSFAQWMNAADVDLVITHPEGYELDPKFIGNARVEYDQKKAFEGADFIYAKNWSNPGVTNPADYGKITSKDMSWTVDTEHMSWTNNGKFLHCLPVRRNLIVTDDVIESPNSLVIPEAANREISCSVVIKRMLETL